MGYGFGVLHLWLLIWNTIDIGLWSGELSLEPDIFGYEENRSYD
jgi:hypothetical protein